MERQQPFHDTEKRACGLARPWPGPDDKESVFMVSLAV